MKKTTQPLLKKEFAASSLAGYNRGAAGPDPVRLENAGIIERRSRTVTTETGNSE